MLKQFSHRITTTYKGRSRLVSSAGVDRSAPSGQRAKTQMPQLTWAEKSRLRGPATPHRMGLHECMMALWKALAMMYKIYYWQFAPICTVLEEIEL